jgi:hypothetical protein
MPDSVIKKFKFFGCHAQQSTFDFADRNGILFEWNNEVNEQQEGLVEEDIIPYPLLAAKLPGVTLDPNTLAIKDKIVPQGCTEDAAAQNANLAPLNVVAGVDGPTIISAQNDKIEYGNNNNDIIQGGASTETNYQD